MNIYVQGNLNIGKQIEHVDTIIENHYSTPQPLQNIEDIVANEIKNSNIPSELNTEQAWKYWTICQEKGWIDENLQPKNITQEQAAIIADAIGAKLNLLHRWSDFEELWKIKNLRGKFDRGYNHNESLQSFAYDVEIAISRA